MNDMTSRGRDPRSYNLVTSFDVRVKLPLVADILFYIKFSHYDLSHTITQWRHVSANALMIALREYAVSRGEQSLMFQVECDPSLIDRLPRRHPFHTLNSERPSLSDEQMGSAQSSELIEEAKFVDRGPTFEMRLTLGSGNSGNVFLHEYTAMSLYGYLRDQISIAEELISAG